jgi:hypothetical protein
VSVRLPVVAVVYAEATAPVVRAQTPPLLAALRQSGRRVDAALFTSPRALFTGKVRSAHERAIRAVADATGVQPLKRTHLPRDRGLESLGRGLAKGLVKRGLAESVLLCRQPRAAIVGIAARDALASRGGRAPRVVLDLRGIRDLEYLMTLGKSEGDLDAVERSRLLEYRGQEELACRRADAVLCVSRPMEKFVRDRYALAAGRVGRVPNHAEPVEDAEALRDAARAELGVARDALLVAYSGTLAAWQMPAASAALFQEFRARVPEARLLFLTPDADAAKEVLPEDVARDAIVRSAPPGETARLLCAADYGLLLRRDDMVNRVACPVKFGEYLACGVRPVLTPYIGDQSRLCEDTGLGVVIGIVSMPDAVRMLAADAARSGVLALGGRETRRNWARENISPARAAERVAEFVDAVVPLQSE